MWRLSRPHPDQLHLTEWTHPVAVLGMALFTAFGLVICLFSISTGSEIVLRCHRRPDGTGDCRLVQTGPQRHQDERFVLADVRLEAEPDVSEGDPICWLRARVGGRAHHLALFSGTDSRSRAGDVVARFERFRLGQAGGVFVIRKDDRSITAAAGYAFLAFGLLPWLWFGIRRLEIDRTAGRLTIRRWGLLPRRRRTLPLAEIRHVRLAAVTDDDGDRCYRLQLDLVDGTHVLVLNAYASRPADWEPLMQALAEAMTRPIGRDDQSGDRR